MVKKTQKDTRKAVEDLAYNPADTYNIPRIAQKQILNERGYIVSELFSVGNGDSNNIQVKNPSDSGVTAIFTEVLVSTQFEATAKVHDSFSSTSEGASNDVDNKIMDSNDQLDTGNMTVTTDATFTSTGTHVQEVMGGGEGANLLGGHQQLNVFALEPGRQIIVGVTNESSTTEDATLTLGYVEVDGTLT